MAAAAAAVATSTTPPTAAQEPTYSLAPIQMDSPVVGAAVAEVVQGLPMLAMAVLEIITAEAEEHQHKMAARQETVPAG
jgi:hypothetical protein